MNRRSLSFSVLLVFLTVPAGSLVAQTSRGLPPQFISLVTKDGVQLQGTYFPAPLQRGGTTNQVAPVVLLHDYKETRAIFNSLARQLQAAEPKGNFGGFAVVTVDLRAHGDSTKQALRDGTQIDLDAAELGKDDFIRMAALDMEAVRSFLVTKNDANELNLNQLCLVGAGMGASVAANWAVQDWSAPPLAIGKQGQDVKAVVLISPRWSYSGLTLQAPMRFRALKENAAWMLIYGLGDSKFAGDAGRVKKQLERAHPEAENATSNVPKRFEVIATKTRLQGSTLLRQAGAPVEQQIVEFLVANVGGQAFPYINRTKRLPVQ